MTLGINRAKSWLYVVINPLISALEKQVGSVIQPVTFSRNVKYLVSDEGFALCFRDLVRNNQEVADLVDSYEKASFGEREQERLKLIDALEVLGSQIMDEFDIPAVQFRSGKGSREEP